nr:kinesin light chain 3 [Quercus suber]
METRITVLGLELPGTFSSMANAAVTYCGQGRQKEAEELDMKSMEKRWTVPGLEHLDMLLSIANLASVY